MSCCSIASGCGIPVTGCTGTSVAAGHVVVDLSANQMPIYVDTCKGDIYYWDGTKWIVLGKDAKFLLYDAASRVLTLQPDGSSVQLPLAGTSIAGLVKVNTGSAISITTDGTLVVDCAALKTQCNLLDKSSIPTGNVIYYNTTTNMLDVDCAKLKVQCGLVDKSNVPTGNVIYYNSTTNTLDVDCTKLKTGCGLASTTDLPVSGPVVKIDPSTKQLQVDCTALKAQCNLASMSDIPAQSTYSFAQQASLNGTTLHIANAQDPAAGVDVDLSSLVSSGGAGGGAENYLAVYEHNGSALVGVQNRTKLGVLQSIEIVAGKVWNGYTGNFVDAGVHPVSRAQGDTQTPMDLAQLVPLSVMSGNPNSGHSLYFKIFEGGIILHYSGGDVTNSDVCGAPYGLKTWGFVGKAT